MGKKKELLKNALIAYDDMCNSFRMHKQMVMLLMEMFFVAIIFSINCPNINLTILSKVASKAFPPIKPGTIRVFVTQCKNKSQIPQFIDAEITLARCEIMEGRHCNEVPYMLDFLYNWYDNLTEETVVFSHHHTSSWHIKNITDAVESIRHTDYFKDQPYGGFKDAIWKWNCDNPKYQDMYSYMFNETSMPRVWTRFGIYPCCATFFVKTEQIRMRPKEEYLQIYKNLEKWVKINPDQSFDCSRLFEYTWHLLLANKKIIPRPDENVEYKFSNLNSSDPCKYFENE